MQGFTKEILETFQEGSTQRDKLSDILNKLNRFGFKDPDIEAVMDVLTARQSIEKAKLGIGPRVIEFAKETIIQSEDSSAKDILRDIELKIQDRCAGADYKLSDAYYQEFFDKAPGGLQIIGGQKISMNFQHIFTTNYDLCIDSFLRHQDYSNGFETKGHEIIFTGNWTIGGPQYFLYKLHGSVNWWEIGGRVTQLSVKPGESLYREKIGDRLMVYPASEKYALRSPYAECLFYLRQQLRHDGNCWIVGYSFRDAPINNAFIDALRFNPTLRLFSVGPHASARTGSLEDPLRSKIKAIDVKFGTPQAIAAIAKSFDH